jgi:hypothetical protein
MTASQCNYWTFKAAGDVYQGRFVMLSTSDTGSVVQANDALDLTIGVSGPFEFYPPGVVGSVDLLHAPTGKMCQVVMPGSIALLQLGTGGATVGATLAADADGKGVAAGTNVGNTFGAIALEAGSANDFIRVLVVPISVKTTT